MDDPMAWLAVREPAPPEELRPMLALGSVSGESISATLGEASVIRLNEVLARPGRDREGAFHLLAADALLTYACEAAADEEDVAGRLSDLLEQLRPDVIHPPASRRP
jgi:hypothetical protein